MSIPTWTHSESELSTDLSATAESTAAGSGDLTVASSFLASLAPASLSGASSSRVTSSTKLSIDELRPLVATPDDINTNMATLQRIEALDLSNGGIVGDQITALLAYLSLSATPVALRSVDLGHNRLGDAGAMALARLVQENASNLPRLTALDLFENGIRDEGARALINAIHCEVVLGNLPQLASVALHDNDISESTLRAIDAVWLAMAKTRALGLVPLPAESASLPFGELLTRQVRASHDTHVDEIAAKLEPLSVFLKHVLWRFVVRDRKLRGKVVLRVFPVPTDPSNHLVLMDKKSAILDYSGESCGTVATMLSKSPKLQEYWLQIEPVRVKAMAAMRATALEDCDRDAVFTARGADETTTQLVLVKLAELHTCATKAHAAVSAFTAGDRDQEKQIMDAALTKSLGLPVEIATKDRYWHVCKNYTEWSIEDRNKVRVAPHLKPVVQDTKFNGQMGYSFVGGGYVETTFHINDESGYEITCTLPIPM